MNLTIVKLGGSLAFAPERVAWLDALAKWGGPLILVPGGGPFASCVRLAQNAMGFSDSAAHRMALMAMEQFGIALSAHSDAFVAANSLSEMESLLHCGRIPIWLPQRMALDAADVPASWEVTSDSLAAWLAWACGARRMLLIKSLDLKAPVSAGDLAVRKIVDPAFPRFAAKSQAEVWVAGPASLAGALAALQRGGLPGTMITVARDGPGP